jgi:hypothetical protein
MDTVTGAPEFARAETYPLRNDPMSTPPSKTAATWRFMIYLFLEAIAETCVSFNPRTPSSQQTSTVLPLILTLMEFRSACSRKPHKFFQPWFRSPVLEVRVREQ